MGMTVTNVDLGSVVAQDAQFRDELLTFGGAGTVKAGTILARKRVSDAVVVAADVGNTGDGTVTAASVAAGQVIPAVGAHVLKCVAAVAHGGVFQLIDPNGAQLAVLTMTAGAGAATVFEAAGLVFTVTDGAQDFIVGDEFAITVAANNKMVPFAIAGAGGAQVPSAVLTYDSVAAGAGDVPIRPAVAGTFRKERLIINADGTGANITNTILDQLRAAGCVVADVKQLSILDNQ